MNEWSASQIRDVDSHCVKNRLSIRTCKSLHKTTFHFRISSRTEAGANLKSVVCTLSLSHRTHFATVPKCAMTPLKDRSKCVKWLLLSHSRYCTGNTFHLIKQKLKWKNSLPTSSECTRRTILTANFKTNCVMLCGCECENVMESNNEQRLKIGFFVPPAHCF